jgi:hypothetical protein
VVQYKTRVTALQEQVKILEDAAKTDNSERSKTLKELATERGKCIGVTIHICIRVVLQEIESRKFSEVVQRVLCAPQMLLCCVELSRGLDEELRKLRETYNKIKREFDQAKEKLKFFEKV